VQDHAFADVEADVDAPLFPLHVVPAGDGEAGPFGLGDADGLLGGAERPGQFRIGVVAVLGRNGHHAEVDDLRDFLVHHVHVGHQPVHGVRPRTVLREVLHKSQAAKDPAPLLLGILEHPGGQRGHADFCHIEIPGGKGVQPTLIGGQQRLHHLELLLEDRKFAGHGGFEHDGGFHLLVREGDDGVGWRSPGDVVDKDPEAPVLGLVRAAGRGAAGPAGPGRIQQAEVGNPVLRPEKALLLQNGLDLEDLRGRGQAECRGCFNWYERHGEAFDRTAWD
jgi:hypothetical protein